MSKIVPWVVGVSAAALLGVMGFTYSGSRRQAEGCGSKCGKVSQGCPDQGGCREGECGGRAWRSGRGAQASEAASRKPCGDANCGVKACVCGAACACAEKCGCKDCTCKGNCASCPAGCEASCGCKKAGAAAKPCGDANCGVKACVCGAACACAEKCGCKDCTCQGKCASCPAGCEASCGCKKTGTAPKSCEGDKGCGAKEGSCSPACPGLDKCGCSR